MFQYQTLTPAQVKNPKFNAFYFSQQSLTVFGFQINHPKINCIFIQIHEKFITNSMLFLSFYQKLYEGGSVLKSGEGCMNRLFVFLSDFRTEFQLTENSHQSQTWKTSIVHKPTHHLRLQTITVFFMWYSAGISDIKKLIRFLRNHVLQAI